MNALYSVLKVLKVNVIAKIYLSIKGKSVNNFQFLILANQKTLFSLQIARGTLQYRHNLQTKNLCLVSPPDQGQ
jgi:hypothetical protein